MDKQIYHSKLEQILANLKPSLNILYQYVRGTKSWKIVAKRCAICGKGFNLDRENKFAKHKCKTNKYL